MAEFPTPPSGAEPVGPDGGYPQTPERAAGDPLGVAAIIVGCIGIVVLGIFLAIVTAVLASLAGSRAREQGRSQDNAYIAFGLAAVDGIVWIVLQMAFSLPFTTG